MPEMNCTEGKWEIDSENKEMVIIENKEGFEPTPQNPKFIIVQTGLYTSPEYDECVANAQLIASAPELYKALKKAQWLLNWVWTTLEKHEDTNGFIYGENTDKRIKDQIIEALNKAEGVE